MRVFEFPERAGVDNDEIQNQPFCRIGARLRKRTEPLGDDQWVVADAPPSQGNAPLNRIREHQVMDFGPGKEATECYRMCGNGSLRTPTDLNECPNGSTLIPICTLRGHSKMGKISHRVQKR